MSASMTNPLNALPCGHSIICYRTLRVRVWNLYSLVRNFYIPFRDLDANIFCFILSLVRDALRGVRAYLAQRVDFEPNPYYKGRYQVALATCVNAYNNLSHPYEIAEIFFRDSRFGKKVESWLVERCERFPYLCVRFDGSLGDWKEPQVDRAFLPVKKHVQSEIPEKVRVKKAGAA